MFSLSPNYEQLSFEEQIKQVNELPGRNPEKFMQLLETHIDLPTLIPYSFRLAYYSSATNDRVFLLESLLAILLLIHFFKFATVSNFSTLLRLSPQTREFCRLTDDRVPDDSVLSKFKIKYERELHSFFDYLSGKVIDIFAGYNETLPDDSPLKGLSETLVLDTTGLKPKVKENNPKTLQSEINRQSNYKKYLESQGKCKNFNVHVAAFKNMPKFANANETIRLGYANGHFGYFYKFGLLTNGFGAPLHLHFFEDAFYKNLPVDFDSPDEQKYAYDNASLRPVLDSFFNRTGNSRVAGAGNPAFDKCPNSERQTKFTTFLGDSEFDSYDNYGFLHKLGFSKVLIPLNERNAKPSDAPIPINPAGTPCCPNDSSLAFIPDGSCKGKKRSLRFKFVCPLSRKVNNLWVSDCVDKCRTSNSTVTHYTYPSGDLRVFFGVHRGSKEWADIYKKRTVIEREISSIKSHPALSHPNTYNCASMKADVCLNAAAKLIVIMIAFALQKPQYMRNLNLLIKTA